MTDIWVCSNCHSINRQRNSRCYKCGANQESAATGEMSTLRQEQAIITRTVVAYRPAWLLGIAASIFLVGLAAVSLVSIIQSIDLMGFATGQLDQFAANGTFDDEAFSARLASANALGLVGLAVIVPGLVFFAAWLSRVVGNVPALGGGLPGTNPGRAFINTLIPLVNLRTVPGMLQDVLYRLDPTAGGLFMIAIAWVGLVGSWIISFVAGWYLDLRLTFDTLNAESLAEWVGSVRGLLTAAFIVDIVTGALIALGAVVLVILILRIERRSAARDSEIRAAAAAGLMPGA
jgi:hypothetical protein